MTCDQRQAVRVSLLEAGMAGIGAAASGIPETDHLSAGRLADARPAGAAGHHRVYLMAVFRDQVHTIFGRSQAFCCIR
jgi:hypothetical protein